MVSLEDPFSTQLLLSMLLNSCIKCFYLVSSIMNVFFQVPNYPVPREYFHTLEAISLCVEVGS